MVSLYKFHYYSKTCTIFNDTCSLEPQILHLIIYSSLKNYDGSCQNNELKNYVIWSSPCGTSDLLVWYAKIIGHVNSI